MYKFR